MLAVPYKDDIDAFGLPRAGSDSDRAGADIGPDQGADVVAMGMGGQAVACEGLVWGRRSWQGATNEGRAQRRHRPSFESGEKKAEYPYN
jgi:hypothetical protein